MTLDYNTAIVLLGTTLLGVCAGVVGVFAVLRRRALIGDTLAHAALPGLCVSYWLIGTRHLAALLAGAFVSGLVALVTMAALRRHTRLKEDAILAMVLSTFFALGIVLLVPLTQRGGGQAGLETYIYGKTAGMIARDVVLIGGSAATCLLLAVLFFKELKLLAFDEAFAATQGWPVRRLDLALMGLIAVVVVVGLPAVGLLLIAALLIIPPTAARFWSDRLPVVLTLSAAIGGASGVAGTLLSATAAKLPPGSVVVLVGGGVFVVSMLLAPRRGLIARWWRRRGLRATWQEQRLLQALWQEENAKWNAERGVGATPADDAGGEPAVGTQNAERGTRKPMTASRHIVRRAVQRGWIVEHDDGLSLTDAGSDRAARLVRAEKLWQRLLIEQPEWAGRTLSLDLDALEEQIPADWREPAAEPA